MPPGGADLKLRVAARPVEGAANRAPVAFLAGALRMRAGDISVLSGEAARHKRLLLAGDAGVLVGRLASWISGSRAMRTVAWRLPSCADRLP